MAGNNNNHLMKPHGEESPMGIAPMGLRGMNLDLPGSEIFSFHTYWQMLRKRRATVFAAAAIVTLLGALYAFKTKPVYSSTAKVEVTPPIPPMQQEGDDAAAQTAGVSAAYLQTQVDILESDDLAWQTITQFGLDKGMPADPPGGAKTLAEARIARSRILGDFESHLHVSVAPDSNIILVGYESTNPALAQQIPNAVVQHYLEYNFRAQYDSTQQVSDWMTKELDDLKHKVEVSQQALVNYEKQNDIADISDGSGSGGSLSQSSLANLSSQLTNAQTELAMKGAMLEAVKENPSAAGLMTKDGLLPKLQEQYGDLETQYAKALALYGPKFYTVVQIQNQLKEVRRLMLQQQKREQAQIQANYNAAQQQVNILSSAVGQQKASVEQMNQLQIPFNILKNEYQTNQTLYQSLLERLKDAEVAAGLRATNVHVLDQAVYPVAPIRPRKGLDVAVGLLSGLLLGVTLAFAQEAMDTSVKKPEDLEDSVGLPVLGVIPKAESLPSGRSWLAKGQNGDGARGAIDRSLLTQPNSAIAEAYRALRTSVLLSSAPQPPKVMLITSTQPREGKTATCANLGLALSQLNKRVLIIDADLRRGQMQKVFGLKGKTGLSDSLTGSVAYRDAIEQVEGAPNLYVLGSGIRPPSPADLLASPAMAEMIEEFRQRFEFILIDTPPLLLVTDPAILSKCADATILVTASETTQRKAVMRAQRILDAAGERFIGAVVNLVDIHRDGDYGYYRYHYNYYLEQEPETLPISIPPDRN